MKHIIAAGIAALVFTTSAQAEHLSPRNECSKLEGADAFQMALVTAVANRNIEMLRPLVDPQVYLDFGGGHGWELMRERLASDEIKLWDELDAVLRLGCAIGYEDSISMPYYFSQEFPEGFDAYGTSVVLGERVPLFRSAAGGRIVRYLNWEAVEDVSFFAGVEDLESAERWEVRLTDGTRGFVDSTKLRSLIDYRLIARRTDRTWLITVFVAGD